MKWKDTIIDINSGTVLQQGTPLEEIPEDLKEYVSMKYPHENWCAAVFERAEQEREKPLPAIWDEDVEESGVFCPVCRQWHGEKEDRQPDRCWKCGQRLEGWKPGKARPPK